jgi:CTP:molybdopterin cytidylyltransferase MocA
MSEFYKSVGEILGENNWVKVAKDLGSLYPNAQLPDNFDASNPYVATAGQLMNDARMIVAIHENSTLHQNGVPPLVDEDYIVLAQKHGDLAEQHRQFAMQLQAANPTGYIQAISGHGDAYGAHLDAQRVAFMMAPVVVDQHWDGKHGQILPARWNTENKVWRAAHRAFLMSQQAFNRTSFDTGVAKSMGESLADVIRHDQDHDNWHAMHGDPPCKSEADCARMRAKYAEVKTETGVAKGDTPGHPFRGNQYQGGHSEVAAAIRSDKKANWAAKSAARRIEEHPEKTLQEHKEQLLAEVAETEDYVRKNPYHSFGGMDYNDRKMAAESIAGRNKAIGAINTYLASVNKSAEIIKGDVAGHAFHGNQYTSASANTVAMAKNANGLKDAGNLHEAYNAHMAARDAHLAVAKSITGQSLTESDIKNAHLKAADAHQEAMARINDAIQGRELGISPQRQAASIASDDALRASRKADGITAHGSSFHGNQYSTVNGNTANDLSNSSKSLYRSARLGGSAADHEEMSREHAHLAEEHNELAEQAYSERNEFLGDAHRKAESAHEDAGAFHTAAAQALAQDSPDYEELKQEAEVESGRAAEASGEAAREDAR